MHYNLHVNMLWTKQQLLQSINRSGTKSAWSMVNCMPVLDFLCNFLVAAR